MREQADHISTVQTAVAAEIRQQAESAHDPAYSALPNSCLLRLHVQEDVVAKTDVERACRTWCGDVFNAADWKVEGNAEAKSFVLRFNSLPRAAAVQAKQARDLLRPAARGDAWTDIYVTKGTQSLKLFISNDASEQQLRIQAIQRKLRSAILESHPRLQIKIPPPRYHPSKPPGWYTHH